MNLESIVGRVKELGSAIEQSAANHNSLVGRLQEAQEILDMLQKGISVVEGIVEPRVEGEESAS